MTRRMTIEEARTRFADLLTFVCNERQPVVLEQEGRPLAVVITPEEFNNSRELAMQHFDAAVAEIRAANKDVDPDEIMREVTALVEEVRQENYDRRQTESGA